MQADSSVVGILDTIVDGVITIDAEGIVLTFNRSCERLFGYRASEILGCNVKRLMPAPYCDEHDEYLAKCKRAPNHKIIGVHREVTGKRKDGTTFPMDLSLGEISDGSSRQFVGVVRDITDRKRMEQSLRDSEEQYRTVLETAIDGVIMIDSVGNIRMYNHSCERMFGFSVAEVVGANVKLLMPSPYYDEHDSYLLRYAQSRERHVIGRGREVIGRRRDGTTFPIDLSVGETRLGGNIFFVGILRDISAIKAADEALRQSEAQLQQRVGESEEARRKLETQNVEMERLVADNQRAWEAAHVASERKSEFLAAMSHEIRTPMNGVLGILELLDRGELETSQRELVQTARSCAEGLLRIINDILDFSKLEAGEVRIERTPFHPRSLLEEIRAVLMHAAVEKNIVLEVDRRGMEDRWFVSDPTRLRQILLNLVGNAVKFTEAGGVWIGYTYRASEQGNPATQMLRFTVRDTGIGIPKRERSRLFERFTQGDASTTRRYGGTGLGLSICRQLVEHMGGEIGFDSTENEGSLFWFTTPCEVCEAPVEPRLLPPVEGSSSHRPLSVLVAEDDPVNRMLIERMLMHLGHSVELVPDGVSAIQALCASDHDLVLMDLQMPRMDGIETTRRIRGLDGDVAATPIVALTANVVSGDRDRCFAVGMDDYLAKPLRLDDLRELLARIPKSHPLSSSR